MPAQNYINLELDTLEQRLQELKEYLNDNPAHKVSDRWGTKLIKGEEVDYVIQTKENILKCVRESMKDYASLLDQINKLREVEEQKIKTRGDKEIPQIAKGFLTKK